MRHQLLASADQLAHRHRQRPPAIRGAQVPYFRRGVLSVPAFKMAAGGDAATDGRQQSLALMAKAGGFGVDALFFDLEDAAPEHPEFKQFARQFCGEALAAAEFAGKVVGFRPNNIRTDYFARDMAEVLQAAGARLDFIVIPKTETAAEVRDIAALVADWARVLAWPKVPQLEVLIESPGAFAQAEAIAAIDGVAALVFGAYDFARCLGSQVHADTWLADQAAVRQLLPVLAAAHGKDALDAVTATLPVRPKNAQAPTDAEMAGRQRALHLSARDAADAARLGYAGKWVLHPDQIAPIQQAFTPSRHDALRALRVCADYARAARAGSGAERDESAAAVRLVDRAVVGMEFWAVQAALRGGELQEEDLRAAGFALEALRAAAFAA